MFSCTIELEGKTLEDLKTAMDQAKVNISLGITSGTNYTNGENGFYKYALSEGKELSPHYGVVE